MSVRERVCTDISSMSAASRRFGRKDRHQLWFGQVYELKIVELDDIWEGNGQYYLVLSHGASEYQRCFDEVSPKTDI